MVIALALNEMFDCKIKPSNQKKTKRVKQSIKNTQTAISICICADYSNDKCINKGGLK